MRNLRFILVCLVMLSPTAAAVLPKLAQPSLAPMLRHTLPAVVNISAVGELRQDDMAHSPKPPPVAEPSDKKHKSFGTIGSGVILDAKNGYILTNSHLIEKASRIVVTLNDGRQFPAKRIGRDTASDVAVLQIKASKLVALSVADSDKVQVGDFVAAIGSPFGLSKTVTSGIVSALDRSRLGIEGYENFIQTDAAINVGNSGGALVNLRGQLIGINTAILSPTNVGSVGIGFAIPINMARSVMQQLLRYGEVKRGLMGVYVQKVTPDLAEAFNLAQAKGALVAHVSPGSPAAAAGMRPGDIVQVIDGKPVRDAAQVRNTVGLHRVGSAVQLVVSRKGHQQALRIVLADPKLHSSVIMISHPLLAGLALHDFKAQTVLHGQLSGVLVTQVGENSSGWRAGLLPGDLVTEVNREPIEDLRTFNRAAAHAAKQQPRRLLLRVVRGPGALFVALREDA